MSVLETRADECSPHSSARSVIAMHLSAGAGWLAASRALGGDHSERRTRRERRAFAVALGARHLGEAALIACRPTRRGVLVGASIDALHALSMLALAVRPAWRDLALFSAAGAASLCAYGIRCAMSEQPALAPA
jgi:hypothetical protein